MTPSTTGRAYHGPVVVLTTDDARLVLSLLHGRPDVAEKLRTAVGADPRWQEPTDDGLEPQDPGAGVVAKITASLPDPVPAAPPLEEVVTGDRVASQRN